MPYLSPVLYIYDVKPWGFLSGIDCATSATNSTKINENDAKEISRMVFYDEAKKDLNGENTDVDKYLADVYTRAKQFAESEEVWDRTELKAAIEKVLNKRGAFACMLGGRDTGKTLVLKDIARSPRNDSKVGYIDLRGNPDLLDNAIDLLSPDYDVRADLADMVNTTGFTWGWRRLNSLSSIFDKPRLKNKPEIFKIGKLLDALIESSKQRGVSVIIDEANIVFQERNAEFAEDLLQLMTCLTKQTRQVLHIVAVNNMYSIMFLCMCVHAYCR
jgi:hypothetical protein